MLDPHEVKEHYESIHKISKKLIQEGGNTQVPTHRALYFLAADNTMIHRGYVCNAGETLSAVMPNGDVLTCRRLPLVVGNLMKQSFFEIWYGNEILWEMRDRNKINFICRKCEYFEKCMGGARCVTYEYCGDQFAPDPQCWKAFKELPSPEKLKSYKPENSKEFSPIHKEIYSIGSEVKPYIQLRENSILYVSEQVKSLSENQFWEINLMNLQSEAEKIIDQRSDFIIIFFKFSEDDLNKKSVEILNFLLKLIDNGINFKVANPIPRCLFDFRYLDITQKFNIPKSCKNCLKLFKIDENDEIKLCIGKKLPKLKYMSNRDQIYEYFRFFNKNLDENNKCKSCLWFIRNKCNGLCKSIEDTI